MSKPNMILYPNIVDWPPSIQNSQVKLLNGNLAGFKSNSMDDLISITLLSAVRASVFTGNSFLLFAFSNSRLSVTKEAEAPVSIITGTMLSSMTNWAIIRLDTEPAQAIYLTGFSTSSD